MDQIRKINFIAVVILAGILASCGIGTHPNEKIIIGTWRPVKVEKVVDSSAIQAAGEAQAKTVKKKTGGSTTAVQEGAEGRKEAELNRLVQLEQRATLEIYPDKTAIKNYPGKAMNAKWKMKGKGKRIVAKNLENKMTFVIDILEISKERIVVIEHVPIGDIKVVYERVFDAN